MKKQHLPSFIDPKTGKRYANYLTPFPTTGKPITEITADEFIAAFIKSKNEELRFYFDQVGWPEGYAYCMGSEAYARETGYPGLLRTIEIHNSLTGNLPLI